MPTKKLILRLSSLGDVILATSALEALKPNEQADWLVRHEYRELVEQHDRVRRVFLFQRTPGFFKDLSQWVQLCRNLWQENYTDIFDLHGSIRTRLCHFLFMIWGAADSSRGYFQGFKSEHKSHEPLFFPRWHSIKKEKWKLYGLYIFKRFWPKQYQPTPWVTRFSRRLGGSGKERPNLTHLIPAGFVLPQELQDALNLNNNKQKVPLGESSCEAQAFGRKSADHEGRHPTQGGLPGQSAALHSYLCIMPSSRWNGKKWPVHYYVELLSKIANSGVHFFPVILGAANDQESFLLSTELQIKKIPHFLGAGRWSLSQTAGILSQSQGCLASDTGLAHLAEAVGVPAQILFGPTVPEMGFGPWRMESHSYGSNLWCRPCGKDGRYCFRLTQRYACLTRLTPDLVFQEGVVSRKDEPRKHSAEKNLE